MDYVSVDEAKALLMIWAKCSRGLELPQGYISPMFFHGAMQVDCGEWPECAQLVERALVEMHNRYMDGPRMVAAIKAEYLPSHPATIEKKAKMIRIRKQHAKFYIEQSTRYLTDVYNTLLQREPKNDIYSGMMSAVA